MAQQIADRRDVDFVLHEQLQVDNLSKHDLFAEFNKHQGDEDKTRKNMYKAIDFFKECGADGWVKKYTKETASIS